MAAAVEGRCWRWRRRRRCRPSPSLSGGSAAPRPAAPASRPSAAPAARPSTGSGGSPQHGCRVARHRGSGTTEHRRGHARHRSGCTAEHGSSQSRHGSGCPAGYRRRHSAGHRRKCLTGPAVDRRRRQVSRHARSSNGRDWSARHGGSRWRVAVAAGAGRRQGSCRATPGQTNFPRAGLPPRQAQQETPAPHCRPAATWRTISPAASKIANSDKATGKVVATKCATRCEKTIPASTFGRTIPIGLRGGLIAPIAGPPGGR